MAISNLRVLLCLVVLIEISVLVRSEPIFGKYYCDLFCADYEDDSSSDSSEDILDLFMLDPCAFCPSSTKKPSRPSSQTTTTTSNPLQQFPLNFLLPSMGMNMTLGKTGNNWFMNFWPFSGSSSSAPHSPAPAAGSAPAASGSHPAPGAAAPAAAAKPAAGNATTPKSG